MLGRRIRVIMLASQVKYNEGKNNQDICHNSTKTESAHKNPSAFRLGRDEYTCLTGRPT